MHRAHPDLPHVRNEGIPYDKKAAAVLIESPGNIPEWLITMPKVELHVHLEGTVQPNLLWSLIQKYDVDLGVKSLSDVAAMFDYSDFTHFIDTFTKCSDCLRSASDLGDLVTAYGAELDRQHVRYAEIHFNPEPHMRRKGIDMSEGLAAMNRSRAEIVERYGIELRWIADGVRDAIPGPIAALRTARWMVEEGHNSGLVALGLGGNEIGFPARNYAAAFELARAGGFHVVAHAGEALGPDSIWEALNALGAERIGHGITAVQDPALLRHLADLRIPLEISPTSNLRTGVVASMEDLPLKALVEAGVPFSISSDDPPMFGTDVVTEYALAAFHLGLDRQGVANLVAATIDQSFADDDLKARLHRELRHHTPLA